MNASLKDFIPPSQKGKKSEVSEVAVQKLVEEAKEDHDEDPKEEEKEEEIPADREKTPVQEVSE